VRPTIFGVKVHWTLKRTACSAPTLWIRDYLAYAGKEARFFLDIFRTILELSSNYRLCSLQANFCKYITNLFWTVTVGNVCARQKFLSIFRTYFELIYSQSLIWLCSSQGNFFKKVYIWNCRLWPPQVNFF